MGPPPKLWVCNNRTKQETTGQGGKVNAGQEGACEGKYEGRLAGAQDRQAGQRQAQPVAVLAWSNRRCHSSAFVFPEVGRPQVLRAALMAAALLPAVTPPGVG